MIINEYTDTSIPTEKAPDKPMIDLMWLLERMDIDPEKIEIIEYEDGKRSVKVLRYPTNQHIRISVSSDRYTLQLGSACRVEETDLLGAYEFLYFTGYRPKNIEDYKGRYSKRHLLLSGWTERSSTSI